MEWFRRAASASVKVHLGFAYRWHKHPACDGEYNPVESMPPPSSSLNDLLQQPAQSLKNSIRLASMADTVEIISSAGG